MKVLTFFSEPKTRSGLGALKLLRMAARELRAGISSFYIFIACIALGVAVIITVGSLSDALRAGFEEQGEVILGGDIAFSRMHRRAEGTERTWLEDQGILSETATLRAMARTSNGDDQSLIEIKAVDERYPLKGAVTVASAPSFRDAVAADVGIVVDPILLERLKVKIGDSVTIGEGSFTIKATLGDEPDSIADRLTYGPRVFMSLAGLDKTKLVQPGTLVRWRYAIALPIPIERNRQPRMLSALKAAAKFDLPESGFSIQDRNDPAPQVTKTLDRVRQFLTFLGLTALLVGGVGVASAVSTFVERRRNVIAIMKTVGATSGTIFAIFMAQILGIAALGVAIGIAVGLISPAVLIHVFGDDLPVRAGFAVSLRTIFTGAFYGFVVAALFALWPLGRAKEIRPSVLFRDEVQPERVWPEPPILLGLAALSTSLFLFAVLMAESQRIALMFCGGLALVLLVFTGLGYAVTKLARRIPRPRKPELALAIANLGAPGGLTQQVVLALGAGLSLLVAVALADRSMIAELKSRLPQSSPNYFVLDIPKAEFPGFEALVKSQEPETNIVDAPLLRGRLIALKGEPVETMKVPPEAQWVMNGDRGLTYDDQLPKGSTLVKGEWWPKDYDGPPLVSFESGLARHLNVDVGDEVTVNVLGRNLTARIANLREVKWESLNLNFVMVFSSNVLRGAPATILATLTLPKTASLEREANLARAIGKAYPAATVVRVKDAIDSFNVIFQKIMVAVRAASSVTLLAGALVLAGALATAQRRRILEAVVLKVIGATRRRILVTHMYEYLLLAVSAAGFAVLLGTLSAWVAISAGMHIPFTFDWAAVGEALGIATILVVAFGLLGTWGVLRARPVAHLRSQ